MRAPAPGTGSRKLGKSRSRNSAEELGEGSGGSREVSRVHRTLSDSKQRLYRGRLFSLWVLSLLPSGLLWPRPDVGPGS